MNRSEKAALIAQIKAKADAASFVVVTDFKGMTVEELTRLRAKLYECGGEYLVVKNTLARIALTDGMHDSVKDMFKENCGIALTSQDPVAVAKAVSEFAKTSKLFAMPALKARCSPPPRWTPSPSCPESRNSLVRSSAP